MNVQDLSESSQWDNQAITLDYLYKKQTSTCHHFVIEVQNLANLNPNDTILLALESAWQTYLLLSSWSSGSVVNTTYTGLLEKYSILKIKFNRMIKAKKAYEVFQGRIRLNINHLF